MIYCPLHHLRKNMTERKKLKFIVPEGADPDPAKLVMATDVTFEVLTLNRKISTVVAVVVVNKIESIKTAAREHGLEFSEETEL